MYLDYLCYNEFIKLKRHAMIEKDIELLGKII